MNRAQRNTACLLRRQEVARLYLQGKYQSEIAKIVGVSQPQITNDLKAIHAAWRTSFVIDNDARVIKELEKIDVVERAAWEGWTRSVEPAETSLTRAVEGDRARREASLKKQGQAGDPRFLDGVLKCIERRCTLLGLDAPTKFKLDLEAMTDTQLRALAAGDAPAQVQQMAQA